jgi:hypothetical protein
MHGLDVVLTVGKELSGMAKWKMGLGELQHAKSWLEVSWFLIIPLVLNAAVLCPIVMRRALAANRELAQDKQQPWPIWFAGFFMLATVLYLTMVFA